MRPVISIDGGLAHCGAVGMLTDGTRHVCTRAEVFVSAPSQRKVDLSSDRTRRVREYARWMGGLLDAIAPVAVVAEALSFPRDDNAMKLICLAWGAFVAELERRKLPLVQAHPQEWRRALTPDGGETQSWRVAVKAVPSFAERAQRIAQDDQEHVLDALGVFVWGVTTDVVRAAVMR